MKKTDNTIFSFKKHTAAVKKLGRIKKAKFFGYHFSKLLVVSVICFGLIATGTYHVSAGSKSRHSSGNTRVSAKTTAGAINSRSNSRASVSNNNSVHINSGGGSGGFRPSISRNNRHNGGGNAGRNHHNNNNGNNKKVVKKKIVRKDIDIDITKDINKTIVNKNITVEKPYYNYCPDDCNYQPSPCSYDNCYQDSYGRVIIINNPVNTNTNTNYNHNVNENYNSNHQTSEVIHYYPGY